MSGGYTRSICAGPPSVAWQLCTSRMPKGKNCVVPCIPSPFYVIRIANEAIYWCELYMHVSNSGEDIFCMSPEEIEAQRQAFERFHREEIEAQRQAFERFHQEEIEAQRQAFERFRQESRDRLVAKALTGEAGSPDNCHKASQLDTSLDYLLAKQLAEFNEDVNHSPALMDDEVQVERDHPETAKPSSISVQHTTTSVGVVEMDISEEDLVAPDSVITIEGTSDHGQGTIQSTFFFAEQLQEVATHPYSEQITSDFMLAKELHELDLQSQSHLPDPPPSIETDFLLAKELQEQDAQATQQRESDYLLAKQLQEEHNVPVSESPQEPRFEHVLHQAGDYNVTPSTSHCDLQQQQSDYLLAKQLQEEHNIPVVETTAEDAQVGQTLHSLQQARDYEVALSVQKQLNEQLGIRADEQLAMQLQAAETEAQPSESIASVIQRSSGPQSTNVPPPWWTMCPKCDPEATRKYHLIDIFPGSDEWAQVTAPFISAGYMVAKMQRIQNLQLWNRLQAEKQLMRQNRPEGFEINEQLLYHTSSASKEVICEEGLDQRLSRKGRFGRGIYFRQAVSLYTAYSGLHYVMPCRFLVLTYNAPSIPHPWILHSFYSSFLLHPSIPPLLFCPLQ